VRVFIVGGTGFVGVSLANRLRRRGEQVTVMGFSARRPPALDPSVAVVAGDGRVPGPWQERIPGHDVVVKLAGSSIFERWTEATKRVLRESRVLTTHNVVAAIPADSGATLVSTSAVGYYGFRGDEELDEAAPPGDDFLARLCVDWEAEALAGAARGVRVCVTRFGLVLGPGGGVLGQLVPLFRRFVGGPVGSGRQWFSWVHIEDLFSALLHVVARPGEGGVWNFTAPGPVRNAEFARELGRALGRPAVVPAPAFAVRLALGEFGSVVLEGQRVVPRRLLAEGFRFAFPGVREALEDVVGRP